MSVTSAVAVFLADSAVLLVDEELAADISADLSCAIDGVLFGGEVPRGPFSPALLDIPTAIVVGNYVSGLSSRHGYTLSNSAWDA